MTTKPDRTIDVYQDDSGKWRWRSKSPNGRIVSISGESFASKGNAMKAAERERVAVARARWVRVMA